MEDQHLAPAAWGSQGKSCRRVDSQARSRGVSFSGCALGSDLKRNQREIPTSHCKIPTFHCKMQQVAYQFGEMPYFDTYRFDAEASCLESACYIRHTRHPQHTKTLKHINLSFGITPPPQVTRPAHSSNYWLSTCTGSNRFNVLISDCFCFRLALQIISYP